MAAMIRLVLERNEMRWDVCSRADGFVTVTERERVRTDGGYNYLEKQMILPEELVRAFLKLRE